MKKLKKALNLKVIILTITGTFLISAYAYCIEDSERFSLRPPLLGSNSRAKDRAEYLTKAVIASNNNSKIDEIDDESRRAFMITASLLPLFLLPSANPLLPSRSPQDYQLPSDIYDTGEETVEGLLGRVGYAVPVIPEIVKEFNSAPNIKGEVSQWYYCFIPQCS